MPSPKKLLPLLAADHLHKQVDLAILTIREDEERAVLSRFPVAAVCESIPCSISYPSVGNGHYTVAVARCWRQGTNEAQKVTETLIRELAPRWIAAVGIAGAVADREFTLGDVVLASHVYDLTVSAALAGGEKEYSLAGGDVHALVKGLLGTLQAREADLRGWNRKDMVKVARPVMDIEVASFTADAATNASIRKTLQSCFAVQPRSPLFTVRPIVSSSQLVLDTAVLELWSKVMRHIAAIEMEFAGVYTAAQGRAEGGSDWPVLTVRGISDVVGLKREGIGDWRNYARNTAAAFTKRLVEIGVFGEARQGVPPHVTLRGARKRPGKAEIAATANVHNVDGAPRQGRGLGGILAVMLSSTLRGDHMLELRNAATGEILRANCHPLLGEGWFVSPDATLESSIRAVDQADVYVLILGDDYGSPVSSVDPRSYSEVEFDRAQERGIPILAFVCSDPRVPRLADPSMSGERVRLRERFRQHIEARAVTCRSFERDKKLQNELTIALMDLATRRRQEVAQTPHAGPGSEAAEFLAAPEYLMLRTQLEGREHELHEISAWAESDDPILVVEAFGGFGKSALSWQWWLRQKHRSDSEGLQRWRKGLWFGFYTEPSMHQFFRRLHAQLTGASQQAAASRPVDELAEESLEFMRRERHLIVMDGLERMLMIGSSLDANGEHPRSHPTSMPSDRFPHGAQARAARDLQDPLLARWLCRVANESRSRILITTRYHPKVLENVGRSPIRGVRHLDLKGLELAGARSYWQSLGFDPGEAAFERLHAAVHGHPLSLAVMGGTLRLSGATSLAVFFAEHPDFAHFDTQVSADGRDDVFRQALAALSPKASVLLETIAAYCYPAPLSDLVGLLCQLGETADRKFSLTEELERHQFGLEEIEDSALAFEDREGLIRTRLELEDRNLVARDGHNAVDLHPVIRSVVLDRAPRHELQKCDNRIVRYYTQAPRVSMPSRAEDLRHEVQAVFSATRAGLWQRATVLCAKSFTDLSLCDHLDRLNEQRDLAKIMDRFFCILRTDRGFSVKWIPEAPPPLQLPQNWGAGISFEDMVRSATGWDDLTLIRYIARTDFAMIAGAAHQAVGEYRLAHAMYELHNETCGQPLCRTMQSTCFRQAGRFGGAFKLLRDGLLELRRHARWRYDPYESSRVADCVFIESIERGQPKRARQAFALKWCIAGASKIESVTGNGTQSEWLRAANLQLARLARAEGDLARGLAIAAEVLEHAGHEGHRKDRVNALRELARASHAAGDYDRALSALDEIVREDRDGGQRGAALTARAERARARIGLGDFDLAREELAMIAQMADDAVETRAVVALYEAELFRRVRDPGGETAALIRGLDLYTLYPGTPMDIEDIRETVARLRELGAIEDRDIEKRQLAVLEPLPDWVRTGWGKWRIKPSDAEFELKTRWHL